MRFLKKLHKWVGLLIGLQVLLWLSSGLMISLLDPDKVSGKAWSDPIEVDDSGRLYSNVLEPTDLPPAYTRDAFSIKYALHRGMPVYRIRSAHGETLLNATDASIITTSKSEAKILARHDYSGNGKIISIEKGNAPDLETRNHSGQYWKVDFSDGVKTSLYISAVSGEIIERRNNFWRARDFFWMLHIMDYQDRQDFNNSLIILVVLIAIWLGISGFILLFYSFNRHDFLFFNIFKRNRQITVTMVDPESGSESELKLNKDSNLFLALATHGYELPSICGGGGECGKCRLKIESEMMPEINEIETGLIPKALREKGFRLACQHEVSNEMKLYMPEPR